MDSETIPALEWNVRRVAEARGITKMTDLAAIAHISLNAATALLHGRSMLVTLTTLEQLCRALRCTPNDLLIWPGSAPASYPEVHPPPNSHLVWQVDIVAARHGITRPPELARRAQLRSRDTAIMLMGGTARRCSRLTLARICAALRCTPNDVLVWRTVDGIMEPSTHTWSPSHADESWEGGATAPQVRAVTDEPRDDPVLIVR